MGMIYRETDIHDKRLVKIFLTPLGVEKRKVASGVVKKFNEYLGENLTETEKMVCIEALQKINRLAQDYQPEEDQ
ncbi:hypothetical protein D3C79_937570 [compost metagenome]